MLPSSELPSPGTAESPAGARKEPVDPLTKSLHLKSLQKGCRRIQQIRAIGTRKILEHLENNYVFGKTGLILSHVLIG